MKIDKNLRSQFPELLVGLMIVIFICFFLVISVRRHHTLNSSYYDLGIMTQIVYNTSQGRILQLTIPDGFETVNRISLHNDLLLVALAPIFKIYPHPETLLFIQGVVVALGALLIYRLAKDIIKSQWLAVTLAFSYLMYPPLQWSVLFDFHAVTLATTFILAMVYFAHFRRLILSFVFFLLALFTKEQVSLAIGFYGLYLAHQKNLRRFGLTMFVVGVAWFFFSFAYLIPTLRGGGHFAYERLDRLESLKSIFTHLFHITTFKYLLLLLGPLLFLPLLSPIFLVTVPEFAINLISSNLNQREIIHHYTAVMTPFFFISAIYGIYFLQRKLSISSKYLAGAILFATLVFSFWQSPLPYSRRFDSRPYQSIPREYQFIQVLQGVLDNENIAIAATDTLIPHFANRKTLIRFGPNYPHSDVIMVLRQSALNDWYQPEASKKAYEDLTQDRNYTLFLRMGDMEVYLRRGFQLE